MQGLSPLFGIIQSFGFVVVVFSFFFLVSSLLSSSYFGRLDSCLLHDNSCLCVYLSLNRKVGFDLQEGFSLQRMCEGCWELLQTEGAALYSRPLGVKSLKVLVLWRQQGPGEQLESRHKLGMAGTDAEQA